MSREGVRVCPGVRGRVCPGVPYYVTYPMIHRGQSDALNSYILIPCYVGIEYNHTNPPKLCEMLDRI